MTLSIGGITTVFNPATAEWTEVQAGKDGELQKLDEELGQMKKMLKHEKNKLSKIKTEHNDATLELEE